MIAERSIPHGTRVYVIGDLHGRSDLLSTMLREIAARETVLPRARVIVVCLGDYVNRGTDTRGVLDLLVDPPIVVDQWVHLRGNHDQMLLDALDGNRRAAAFLVEHGGRATAASYGLRLPLSASEAIDAILARLPALVPERHRAFLRGTGLSFGLGDYFFCHAGVRPGVPLARQSALDLLWIRDGFMDAELRCEACIVHGHTPVDAIRLGPDRIAVDLGGYATNRLGAVLLEGARQQGIEVAC
ncbi:metallophosphoesterase [Salinarimonas sp.]|uniref:metallophosphoesterase n=1 Tax=Salinarimonas sp. TaxID=2766526 RepID=UPI00391D559C